MRQFLAAACTLACLALTAGGALAQRVSIDFDESYEFGGLESYAWAQFADTSLERRSPLMHERIVAAVDEAFQEAGGRKVESDPQVYVSYHTKTLEKLRVDHDSWGYGYPSRWHRWHDHDHHVMHETTVTSYTEGTLIIDVWDPETRRLVWRASVTGLVPRKPERAAHDIERALDKIAKKWRKMKAKGKVRTSDR